MKLTKCKETDEAIHVEWLDVVNGDEATLSIAPNEKPLPSFEKALAKLGEVAASIVDLPKKWMTDTKSRVDGVSVYRNKYGSRSVALHLRSTLKNGTVWAITTPRVRIDEPAEGESNIPLGTTVAYADRIKSFIHEAEAYTDPKNRSQQTFLDDTDPDPGEDGEELEL